MLERNRRIKLHPERFQLTKEKFDVVITCEERVYDQVIECVCSCSFLGSQISFLIFFLGLENKENESNAPVHVINIDIQDNHEEATIGAFMICELIDMVNSGN
jgi:RNA polymerase II subunit A C-terminal domain phosphatase SSU72